MANFSAIKGGRVGLSETGVVRGEFSLCYASSSKEKKFLLIVTPPSRQALLEKNGVNSWSERERLHPTYHSASRVQNRPDETPDTRLCHIFCTHIWEHFIPHLRSPFLVGGKGNSR